MEKLSVKERIRRVLVNPYVQLAIMGGAAAVGFTIGRELYRAYDEYKQLHSAVSASCPDGVLEPDAFVNESQGYLQVRRMTNLWSLDIGVFHILQNPEVHTVDVETAQELEGWHGPTGVLRAGHALMIRGRIYGQIKYDGEDLLLCYDPATKQVYSIEVDSPEEGAELLKTLQAPTATPTEIPLPEPTDIGPLREGNATDALFRSFRALNLGILGPEETGDN